MEPAGPVLPPPQPQPPDFDGIFVDPSIPLPSDLPAHEPASDIVDEPSATPETEMDEE
jgi:hypothetical protein